MQIKRHKFQDENTLKNSILGQNSFREQKPTNSSKYDKKLKNSVLVSSNTNFDDSDKLLDFIYKRKQELD